MICGDLDLVKLSESQVGPELSVDGYHRAIHDWPAALGDISVSFCEGMFDKL